MERKMGKTGIMIAVLLASLALMANLSTIETSGTIDIGAEGSVDSSTMPIQRDDSFSKLSTPPPTEWNETYGGTSDDRAYSVVETVDGGYAIAGRTYSFGAGGWDFWLVKTDASGNMQWNKTYGGTNRDEPWSVIHTTDGGYAIFGQTWSFGAGAADFWLVKTDASGNMQWNKTYGGAGSEIARGVIQIADGGYALAGSTNSFGAGSEDLWLVKTDQAGNMQWNKTYGGLNHEAGVIVVQTSDGGYAIAGDTYSFGAGAADFWLVKTDASGNMQWNKTYGGTSDDNGVSVVQTSDGGYAIAGRTYSFGAGGWDFWLVRTDASGNMQWNKTYGGTNVETAYSVVQTVDGGYALTGNTASFGAGNGDFWLVRTDASGNMQWNKTYGGTGHELAFSVIEIVDMGYALAGYTTSLGAGAEDFWLVKTGPDPSLVHDIAITDILPTKTVVRQNYTMSINVTVENQGGFTETFNVTLYGQPQTAINETGLVGYWKFDEGTGTTAYDSSGYSNDGILINEPTWTSGKIGGALSFDGSDDYVVASHSASLDITGTALTLAAWVRPNSFSGGLGGFPQFVLKGDGSPSYFFGLTNDGMGFLRGGDAQAIAITTDDALTLGAWNHVAMTFDGSSFRFYKDGVLVHNGSYSGSISSVTQDLHIGGQPYYSNHFSGIIDEVKIYNRTLSAGEISAEYVRVLTTIQTQTVTLESDASTTLTFTWNTTGFAIGNYTISAVADTVPGETETADNTYTDGIVTVRLPIHDVAVVGIVPPKTVVGKGYPMNISTTIENQGDFTETLNVTAYANTTAIETKTVNNLANGTSTVLTFEWNSSGFAKGNYTISAYAWPVPGETDTADNNLTDGWVIVAMVGDITGPTPNVPDGKVDIRDVALVAKNFGQNVPPAPPNCDLTSPTTGVPDDKIDIRDIATVAKHFGEIDP